ncbi:MAG TPA: biotin transporter BioY [Devosiaceae bacterium]
MSKFTDASALGAGFVPLRLADRSLAIRAAAVALGIVFLTLASWTQVPMYPVPMTLQTFAVLAVGALYGARMGALTIVAWLAIALVGAPVLSEFKFGPAVFVGPTAGYLVGFAIAGFIVGRLAELGWTRNVATSLATMVVGEIIIMGLGTAWLAHLIGVEKAVQFGFAPFVIGDTLKIGLAAIGATGLSHVFGRK